GRPFAWFDRGALHSSKDKMDPERFAILFCRRAAIRKAEKTFIPLRPKRIWAGMTSPPEKETASQFQKGYRAVPISEEDKESSLRLCAVVREAPDPVAGIFVLLRDTAEESVFLGCLLDKGGHVHLWVELWIQNLNNFETHLQSRRETFSNHI